MSTSNHQQCPECDAVMILGARPLWRIFGDVRAFECSNCEHMVLVGHPTHSTSPLPAISGAIEAAE
jgi:hypothetical protein